MIIQTLPVGPIMANCYILGCEDTKQAIVIDPGDEADQILMALAQSKLTVTYILNTHGHFDHVGGNRRIKEVTGAILAIHKEDEPMLSHLSASAASFGLSADNSPMADQYLKEGDTICAGSISLEVIHTPGHTRGGVCLYTPGYLFSGDTLFAGSIGRTDLPGGDYDTLINSIRTKLLPLPKETMVYPGHGPESSIETESRINPFLR